MSHQGGIVKKNIHLIFIFVSLALIFGLAYRNILAVRSMLSIGDPMPFFTTYDDLLTSLLSSWSPYGLGGFSAAVPGLLVLQGIMSIFNAWECCMGAESLLPLPHAYFLADDVSVT